MSAAKLTATIAEIAVLVRAVEGITGGAGIVTEYFQHAENEEATLNAYTVNKGTPQALVHCWIVRRASGRAPEGTPRRARKIFRIAIDGFRAVGSATDSERVHQELTETVGDALNNVAHGALDNQAGYIKSFAQITECDMRLFANRILCWHTRIEIDATPWPLA